MGSHQESFPLVFSALAQLIEIAVRQRTTVTAVEEDLKAMNFPPQVIADLVSALKSR